MKKFTKLLGIVLIIALVMSMGITAAFAANADKDSEKGGQGTVTITEAHKDQTYELYRVFEAIVNETDNTKVSYKPLSGKTIPTNDYFKVWVSALVSRPQEIVLCPEKWTGTVVE